MAVKIPPKGPSPFFVSSTNEILFELIYLILLFEINNTSLNSSIISDKI